MEQPAPGAEKTDEIPESIDKGMSTGSDRVNRLFRDAV
jgi:hypothetical protein